MEPVTWILQPAAIMSKNSKISVTIITGFLGAGKTTFINLVLKQNPDTRFALVENEFGEISIDSKLVKGVNASQMFELKQGCICCTISDEFELVLRELAERFPDVEHVLIETTGIADTAAIIRPFFADEILKDLYTFNGTVCLVDALNFEKSPEPEIQIKQIVVADLLLISKSDKVPNIQKEIFEKKLQKINPFARVDFLAPFGVLGVNKTPLFQLNIIQQKEKSIFDFVSPRTIHNEIQSQTLSFNQPLNKTEFECWLEYTLDIYKSKIYRTKGILCFENELYEFILQGVGGSFEILEGENLNDSQKSQLVFIGKLTGLELKFHAV